MNIVKVSIFFISTLFLGLNFSYAQIVDWSAETGLPAGSTFVDGQVISDFAGTGVSVTINVNVVNGFPLIAGGDPTVATINNANGASFTLSVNNTPNECPQFDIFLNNRQNLLRGERIRLSNPDGQDITIEETSSNGGARMTVDGVAMSGALPSTIVGDDSVLIREYSNSGGTNWNASMDAITGFTWLYNTGAGSSFSEGFVLTIRDTTVIEKVPTLNQWGHSFFVLMLMNIGLIAFLGRRHEVELA